MCGVTYRPRRSPPSGRTTSQDGPGQLIGAYMVEEDPQAGDVANENLLDD
jgi:hypothetical protein